MARNITEFTAFQVIQYLKERDEEIKRLRRGIEKFKMIDVTDDVKECPICKEWIIEGSYSSGNDIRLCAGCSTKMCGNCRKKYGFIHKCGERIPISLWFCGECKNSGPAPEIRSQE